MKKLKFILPFLGIIFLQCKTFAQDEDKSKRPSPPAMVKETTTAGVTITIDYSQPAVKGRTIGKDLEPMQGKVWRTGANEATVFEVSKDVKIEGKELKAGKYGFFSIWNGNNWTLIFNKTWKQWGAFKYVEGDDVLRVTVPSVKVNPPSERMTFKIEKSGNIKLAWGNTGFNFTVK